jgi:hypothetical protein
MKGDFQIQTAGIVDLGIFKEIPSDFFARFGVARQDEIFILFAGILWRQARIENVATK